MMVPRRLEEEYDMERGAGDWTWGQRAFAMDWRLEAMI
jgi:hypothetical protein